jgi:hypothetical protein
LLESTSKVFIVDAGDTIEGVSASILQYLVKYYNFK